MAQRKTLDLYIEFETLVTAQQYARGSDAAAKLEQFRTKYAKRMNGILSFCDAINEMREAAEDNFGTDYTGYLLAQAENMIVNKLDYTNSACGKTLVADDSGVWLWSVDADNCDVKLFRVTYGTWVAGPVEAAPADAPETFAIEAGSEPGQFRVVSSKGRCSGYYDQGHAEMIQHQAHAMGNHRLLCYTVAERPAPALSSPAGPHYTHKALQRMADALNDSHARTGAGFYVDFGKGGCVRCYRAKVEGPAKGYESHTGYTLSVKEIGSSETWWNLDPSTDTVRDGFGTRQIILK